MANSKKSIVWDFFNIDLNDQTNSICNLCKCIQTRGTLVGKFTTSNMLQHLKKKHRNEYLTASAKRDVDNELSKKKLETPKLMTFITKNSEMEFDNPRAIQITNALGEMIVEDNEPFYLLERKGFIKFMKTLEPRYRIPPRKYMSKYKQSPLNIIMVRKLELTASTSNRILKKPHPEETASFNFIKLSISPQL